MGDEYEIPTINTVSWKLTGLTPQDLPEAIKQAQQEINEVESVLFPS